MLYVIRRLFLCFVKNLLGFEQKKLRGARARTSRAMIRSTTSSKPARQEVVAPGDMEPATSLLVFEKSWAGRTLRSGWVAQFTSNNVGRTPRHHPNLVLLALFRVFLTIS